MTDRGNDVAAGRRVRQGLAHEHLVAVLESIADAVVVLDLEGWRMWLGVVDGEPVGTAAAHVTDTLVDVEWISTKEAYRGRRIGEALTWAATLAAPELPAMLFASDIGQPIYRRMGYQNLARLTLWIGKREQQRQA